ncbi:class I SAM-dependent methyltransferase [Serratia ficaria]|uniref:class I SAM-dependent methyltransferase n=1 Tax=Serratia ficaria TaxID=61651 RepID=UPI00217B427B|nr:methyltransferase domain-containing protein [Serratia ficaria]CAI1655945.1 tellurite resistance protein TehB [Serratia ficaria]
MENNKSIFSPSLLTKHENGPLTTNIYIEPASSATSKGLWGFQPTELSAIASCITALVSFCIAVHTVSKYREDKLQQQKIILRERKITLANNAKEKIEKFYGPLNSLLEESRIIYSHFALKEKEKLKADGKYFRTLRYLIQNNSYDNNGLDTHDKELLLQIIDISDKIMLLIESNSGLVDNPELHTLLGKLIAHYRILKCAARGVLNKDNSDLEEIVFPLEINGALDSEIRKLQVIIEFDTKTKSEELKNNNIIFYDKKYVDYYKKTSSLDMSDIYNEVRNHFKPGTAILDAGCGVGRDTEYFIKHGYKVTPFDASKKMVYLCNQYPFSFCEQFHFNEIDYPPKFDLVWACASLLHLNEAEFVDASFRLYKSIKKGGIIYFSLKNKIRNTKSDKRDFYYHSSELIRKTFLFELNMTLIKEWETYSNLSTSNDVFLNYIYKK